VQGSYGALPHTPLKKLLKKVSLESSKPFKRGQAKLFASPSERQRHLISVAPYPLSMAQKLLSDKKPTQSYFFAYFIRVGGGITADEQPPYCILKFSLSPRLRL
jgi:hypothetical protein